MIPDERPTTIPDQGDRRASWRGSRRDRVTPVAMAVSAVLHVVVALFLYPLFVGPPPEGLQLGPVESQQTPQGTEVIRLVEIVSELSPVEVPEVVRDEAPPEVEVASPVDPDIVDLPEPLIRRPLTTAERVRPRVGDPRLWGPLDPEAVEVEAQRMAQLRIIWAIEDLSDSAAVMAAARAAALDWTATDGDGNKWGISPGKIHLGSITIPLPNFSFSPPYLSDSARRAREDAEIARNAGDAAAAESLADRARAIRERKDRERAAARPPPDTTRVRRR